MTTESNPAPMATPASSDYRYAGPWIRLLALIIDGILLFVALFLMFMGIGLALAITALPVESFETTGWPGGAVVYVAMSILMLAWYGGWQANVGGTPGMLLLKLRVRGPSGLEKPSLRQAVLRNSPQVLANFGAITGSAGMDGALAIFGLVVCVSIGISISNSPTRQGFHDRLAGGTYVVRRGSA